MTPTFSIRRRLTAVLALGFGLVTAGAGAYSAASLSRSATAEFDGALLAKARSLLMLTDQEDGQIEFDYQAGSMPEFGRAERPEYFQIWLDSGQVLFRSGRLGADLPVSVGAGDEPAVSDVTLPDGRRGRMVELPWVPRGPEDPGEATVEPADAAAGAAPRSLVLALARDREPLDRLLASVRTTMLLTAGAAVAIALWFVWRTLAIGLRPLTSVAVQVARLDAEELHSRVALPQVPLEIEPIVRQLNDLLHRLHASFTRERRFAGNLAHELRTPLAELRSLAAVATRWPDDRSSVVRFFEDVRDISDRMEAVVADLLLLARCSAGLEQVESARIGLAELVATTWARLSPQARTRGLQLDVEVPADLAVRSDPGKLAIVFANVLGNAVSHARANTRISCVATVQRGYASVTIGNEADTDSRDADRGAAHVGLGLSLIAALTDLLRMRSQASRDRSGRFLLQLDGLAVDRTAVAAEAVP